MFKLDLDWLDLVLDGPSTGWTFDNAEARASKQHGVPTATEATYPRAAVLAVLPVSVHP